MNENDFKRWVRDSWAGWLESYEPRRGTGIGIPDIQIVVDKVLIPVELKVGEIENGWVIPREVRPAQIQWHRELNHYGVRTVLLIGVYDYEDEVWLPYPIDGRLIANWRNGFEIIETIPELLFDSMFTRWCRKLLTT